MPSKRNISRADAIREGRKAADEGRGCCCPYNAFGPGWWWIEGWRMRMVELGNPAPTLLYSECRDDED